MNITPKAQKHQEQPNRDIQEAQICSNQNKNSIEGNSGRCKNKTIRLLPADDYFKSKITELQQETNRLRCQLSNAGCNNIRQRNSFLNKIQIISMQNSELKQRQNNLNKIINTLQQALKPKNQSENQENQRQQSLTFQLNHELQQKKKLVTEYKKAIEQLKKKLRFLQDQKRQIQQQKDAKIEELTRKNKQLMADHTNQIIQVEKSLNKLPFNKQVMQAIFKALNLNIKLDLSYDDLDFEDVLQESPVSMRRPAPDRRGNDTSYSRISSRSIINQLSNNRPEASDYESEYYQEDPGQLILCQKCGKIYEINQFQFHMAKCSKQAQLLKHRQQLQKTISQIDCLQRESVSQRRWHNKHKNKDKLTQLNQNSRSPCKLTRRESNNTYANPSYQLNKKISNYNKSQSNAINYRSTKFY